MSEPAAPPAISELDLIRDCMAIDGEVTLRCPIPGKWIFSARLMWRHCHPINGAISTSIEGALANLEEAIRGDARVPKS